VLPAPSATELFPLAAAPTPTAVAPVALACELLPTAVLFDPDADAPCPPADEFDPVDAGGVGVPGEDEKLPPLFVVRWLISVVNWVDTASSCETFTASVPA
jgi:hypothetical protein